MKKTYSSPRFYCEDLRMNPIVTASCEGSGVYECVPGTYEPNINSAPKDVILHQANSFDCVGWGSSMNIETGMFLSGWGFNTVSDVPTASVCNAENIDAAIIAAGGDPMDSWYNLGLYPYECYNGPAMAIANFSSM